MVPVSGYFPHMATSTATLRYDSSGLVKHTVVITHNLDGLIGGTFLRDITRSASSREADQSG
jgi:hypothetical protein